MGDPAAQPPASFRVRVRSVLAWWPTVLFGVLGVVVVGWIGRSLFQVQIGVFNPRSDFWEHTAVLRALMDHPLSPRNPHLDTSDPSPRFMPVFLVVALAARVAQLDAIGAMALAGTVHVAILIVGIYAFFRTYFRDSRAPLYGLIVGLGSWYHGFSFSNVYQLSMLLEVAGYPSTACVGFTFLTFAIAARALRPGASRLWVIVLCLSTVNAVLTHVLTATMTVTGVMAMAVFESEVPWRRRLAVFVAALAACFLVELWPYFSTWHTLLGGRELDNSWVVDGFEQVMDGELREKQHTFYQLFPLLETIGFALVGFHAFSCFLFTGRHRFAVAGAAIMMVPFVLNSFVTLPLGHRFILLVIPYLQIGTVWLLLRATPGFHEGWWVLRGRRWRRVVASLGVMAFLGTMTAVNIPRAQGVTERKTAGRPDLAKLCRAVAAAAGSNAVILADSGSAWPLPTCGVKVVSLRHANPLVPDMVERGKGVQKFLSAGASTKQREAILDRYRVTHVLTHRRTPRQVIRFLRNRGVKRTLPGGFAVYTLNR